MKVLAPEQYEVTLPCVRCGEPRTATLGRTGRTMALRRGTHGWQHCGPCTHARNRAQYRARKAAAPPRTEAPRARVRMKIGADVREAAARTLYCLVCQAPTRTTVRTPRRIYPHCARHRVAVESLITRQERRDG